WAVAVETLADVPRGAQRTRPFSRPPKQTRDTGAERTDRLGSARAAQRTSPSTPSALLSVHHSRYARFGTEARGAEVRAAVVAGETRIRARVGRARPTGRAPLLHSQPRSPTVVNLAVSENPWANRQA